MDEQDKHRLFFAILGFLFIFAGEVLAAMLILLGISIALAVSF